jgi:5-methylcytosine-specific restriction endonuclease McrA
MASARWQSGSTRAWRKQRARVIERDGNRCTHVDDVGERCEETEDLTVDHSLPGADLIVADEELRTRCSEHNPTPKAAWSAARDPDAAAKAQRTRRERRALRELGLMPPAPKRKLNPRR